MLDAFVKIKYFPVENSHSDKEYKWNFLIAS